MEVEWIGVIALLAGLFVLLRGPELGIMALALSTLLGSAAAFQMPALGGTSIPPSIVMLFFFVAAATLSSPRIRALLPVGLAYPTPGFWLAGIAIFGLLSSYFLPRIFSGLTSVYPLARLGPAEAEIVQASLQPTSGNITQPAYLLASLVCFATVCAFAAAGGTRTVARAIMLTAVANLGFVVLDFLTDLAGMQDILAFIRNANYRLFEAGDVDGVRRIIGSFTEAGAFAYTTLGLFAFSFGLWLQGVWTWTAGSIALLLLAALLLSTSSAAYGALAVYGACLYVGCLGSLVAARATPRQLTVLVGSPVLLVALAALFTLVPAIWDPLSSFFDAVYTNKLISQSGIERGLWNEAAAQSFFETFGMGTGLGSVRASSFLFAILANLGVIGAVLIAAFFASLAMAVRRPSADPTERAVERAATAAWIALLIQACLDAGSPDLGLNFYIFAGLAAVPALRRLLYRPDHKHSPLPSRGLVYAN